jgi:hypothetical protein
MTNNISKANTAGTLNFQMVNDRQDLSRSPIPKNQDGSTNISDYLVATWNKADSDLNHLTAYSDLENLIPKYTDVTWDYIVEIESTEYDRWGGFDSIEFAIEEVSKRFRNPRVEGCNYILPIISLTEDKRFKVLIMFSFSVHYEEDNKCKYIKIKHQWSAGALEFTYSPIAVCDCDPKEIERIVGDEFGIRDGYLSSVGSRLMYSNFSNLLESNLSMFTH